MLARILTAVVLIPLVVALVLRAPAWLVDTVAAVVLFLALYEFFQLAGRVGIQAYRKWAFLCAAAIFVAQWRVGTEEVHSLGPDLQLVRHASALPLTIESVFLLFALGAAAIGVMSRQALSAILPSVGASAAGLLLIALPFSFLLRLQAMPEFGPRIVLFTLSLVWAGDVLAYFVGSTIGRIPLARALSPQKTWEGAIGNVVGSLIVAVCFVHWLGVPVLPLLVTAALANVAGQLGDLIESAYKRGAGVKDSGALLPGHGGMLDRIDSLILAAPVVWLGAQWMLL